MRACRSSRTRSRTCSTGSGRRRERSRRADAEPRTLRWPRRGRTRSRRGSDYGASRTRAPSSSSAPRATSRSGSSSRRSTRWPTARLLPERFAVVGVARTEQSTAQFTAAMKTAIERHARDPFSRTVWDKLTRGLRYVTADFADEAAEDDLDRVCAELEAKLGTRRESRLLPIDPAPGVRDERPRDRREAGSRRVDAGHRREAVRPRRGLRAEAERAPAPLVPRGRDLPDRPLPRQGDGAEHARAAVRERDLRARLEPPVHRPRPDHGRRVDGHRGPRRRSTSGPARSATSSRTTCCSCWR